MVQQFYLDILHINATYLFYACGTRSSTVPSYILFSQANLIRMRDKEMEDIIKGIFF